MSYLTQHTAQLPVKSVMISGLDDGYALPTNLPACAVKPLRWSQHDGTFGL